MSTYGDMASRIADELSRTDLTGQIQSGILRAILFHGRRRWWFNEQSFTFNTVAGQEYYSETDTGAQTLSRIVIVDTATLIVGNNRYPINQRTWQYINQISVTTTTYGQPQDFCLYSPSGWNGYDWSAGSPNATTMQMRLYPIPDLSTYQVIVAGVLVPSFMNSSSPYDWPGNDATDVWSIDLEDLICTRAKWDVCKNYLKDMDAATAAKAEETDALQSLTRINAIRLSSGSTMPNPF